MIRAMQLKMIKYNFHPSDGYKRKKVTEGRVMRIWVKKVKRIKPYKLLVIK